MQGVLCQVSQLRKLLKKTGIREFCPPNLFNLAFLYQNERFHNFRTRKCEVNEIRGKSVEVEKDGKCDKWILHVSYQPPAMFSTFLLLAYIKCF